VVLFVRGLHNHQLVVGEGFIANAYGIRGRVERGMVCVSAIAAAILVCGVSFSQDAKVDPHIRTSCLQQTP
jgi:hypothetical protein